MSTTPHAPQAVPLQPGDLVTEREAAAILGVQRKTLQNWRTLRKGPRAKKIGAKIIRYNRADLLAFIENGEEVA